MFSVFCQRLSFRTARSGVDSAEGFPVCEDLDCNSQISARKLVLHFLTRVRFSGEIMHGTQTAACFRV